MHITAAHQAMRQKLIQLQGEIDKFPTIVGDSKSPISLKSKPRFQAGTGRPPVHSRVTEKQKKHSIIGLSASTT